MFSTNTYTSRRNRLRSKLSDGKVLLFSNAQMPRNEPAATYRFRQDSSFLYFTGIDKPGLVLLLDLDSNKEILFGTDPTEKELIWTGTVETVEQLAHKSGIRNTQGMENLPRYIDAHKKDRWHILPPYTYERQNFITKLAKDSISDCSTMVSNELIRAVVEMRLSKEQQEIAEIENTLDLVTANMFDIFMNRNLEGISEQEIVGEIEGLAWQNGCHVAYASIVTRNGQILHNEEYKNTLQAGDLLLVDAGAEASSGYATDITRTIPVSGKFTPQQKAIYELVLNVQQESLQMIKPGITYAQVHRHACLVMIEGLIELGLMKGNPQDAFDQRAHQLFFPHGLGHAMGLDVHDMADMGKVHVSYDNDQSKDEDPGTANLRFARTLKENYVLTVEPGIYFIPLLIEKWSRENEYPDFINYSELEKYKSFGGIRIEDDIVVTPNGHRVLGKPIPKSVADIEKIW